MTPHKVQPLPIRDVNGNVQFLKSKLTLTLEMNGFPCTFDFYITTQLPADALLGIEAIKEAGWLIDSVGRSLIHKTHALPPLSLAPCPHTSTLAYAEHGVYLPPRIWKTINVRTSLFTSPSLCFTPTLPPALPLHGAPVLCALSSSNQYPLLICNSGTDPIWIPRAGPIAFVEPCKVLASSAPPFSDAGEVVTIITPIERAENFSEEKRTERAGEFWEEKHDIETKEGKQLRKVRISQVFDLALAESLWPHCDFQELKKLLRKWESLWSKPELVGRTDRTTHRINTGDALPIAQPLRRIAWAERDVIRKEVGDMMEQKIVVESESPWASPPVLVRKRDGTVQFCIDYRKLNEVTVADQYPLPRIDDVLDALSKGRYFAVIDLKAGYWQIPLEASDAQKTAFRTIDGLFQFNVMPFGLRNAPATFQRLMDVVFSGLKWKGLLVYMDDIVIYSETPKEHLSMLDKVCGRLSVAGLKINPKKSTVVATEVRYLGHIVSADGIKPDMRKVEAVRHLKNPSNVREVRMFLGLVGYYRKFIPAFAATAEPLYALTKKRKIFEWTDICQSSFEFLKEKLCSAPILTYPRRDHLSIVDCDASDIAAGAVLMQQDKEGRENVIQYASYTFSTQERKWITMEKEAFAMVWAVTTFRTYLLGHRFVIRTDNSAASTLRMSKQPKLQRWAIILAEFEYTVEHRPGKRHSHVDALSRLPVEFSRSECKDQELFPTGATFFTVANTPPEPSSSQHSSLPVADWATVGDKDPEIQAIKDHLQDPAKRLKDTPLWFQQRSAQERSRFVLDGKNVVYRGFPPKERSRWLVPTVLREPLVIRHHRGAHGAHIGVNKLNAQLALKFYWPTLITTIKKVVQHCERCQRAKAAPAIIKATRMLNREALWSTIALDFFGPLPRTARGNIYILVAIDHFSRWPEAIATRVANAEIVAQFLHHRVFSYHGTPKEMLTDHGSHFASRVIATLCQKYKIRRLMSTPYTPQGNGIVERFMGYLKNSLIAMIDRQPKKWDESLSSVLFAYRATPHPEVGDTPFFINRGYDPLIPELLALDAPVHKQRHEGDWVEELHQAWRELEDKVAEQQERIAKQVQERENSQLQEGQLVLVKRTPAELQAAHTKLTDKYDHPARVLQVMPNKIAYQVIFVNSGEKAIINRRNLRPFYEDTNEEDLVFPGARTTKLPIAPLSVE